MPNYAVIENGNVINTVVADPEYAASQGWVALTDNAGIGWSYANGQFVDNRPPPTTEQLAAQVRAERDRLLTASDVNVLPDRWAAMTPETQAEWSTYRQALRDIPQQPGFPTNVVWPQKP